MADIEESNLSLEKIISEVDYVKLGEDYIPSTFAIKFINFIKLVNGEAGEENKSPLFHYEILDTIHKHNNVLVVVFRGGAKTTITANNDKILLIFITFPPYFFGAICQSSNRFPAILSEAVLFTLSIPAGVHASYTIVYVL